MRDRHLKDGCLDVPTGLGPLLQVTCGVHLFPLSLVEAALRVTN